MSPAEIAARQEAAVEELQNRVAALAAQRQRLRAMDAGWLRLEKNRLELIHTHGALSLALIERHRPALSS
jgi:hypothetical protein